jgi:hypothetical protein
MSIFPLFLFPFPCSLFPYSFHCIPLSFFLSLLRMRLVLTFS